MSDYSGKFTALENQSVVVLNNQTITATGSSPVSLDVGIASNVQFVFRVNGPVTGTGAQLQFSIHDLDRATGNVVFTASSTFFNTPTTNVPLLFVTRTGLMQLNWNVTGTTPSFGGVFASASVTTGGSMIINSGGVEQATTANPLLVSGRDSVGVFNSSRILTVQSAGIGSPTQPVSGSIFALGSLTPSDSESNPTTAVSTYSRLGVFNGSTWDRARGDIANGLDVDVTRSALPTGASTSALQTTGNTSLSSIDGKIPALGQALMTGSLPVVLASNQSAIPVTQSGVWSLSLPAGASTAALQTTGNASLASIDSKTPALGQTTMAGSSPVVIASNQSAIPTTNASVGAVLATPPTSATLLGADDGTNLRDLQGRIAIPESAALGLVVRPLPYAEPTFVAISLDVATANNKSMLAIANTSASAIVCISRIFIYSSRTVAATGVAVDFRLHRFATVTGGTAVISSPVDTAATLPVGISVVTGGTIATETSLYRRRISSTEEMVFNGNSQVAVDFALADRDTPLYELAPNTTPILLRQNQGLHIRCATNTTTGIFDVIFEYTVM
jgi:hypothetical protein